LDTGIECCGSARDVTLSGDYAYVADGTRGLLVIDIADPANPRRVGQVETGRGGWGVAISGNYAYVADSQAGLAVIDVSRPSSPERVGEYPMIGGALGVALWDRYVHVAAGAKGVEIINISNPAKPERVGGYVTGGDVAGVTISGGYIYLADHLLGLVVVRLQGQIHGRINDSQLLLEWNHNDRGMQLQRATRLFDPDWQEIDGSTQTNQLSFPLSNSSAFFRLVGRRPSSPP
jgi:hypothetical protein